MNEVDFIKYKQEYEALGIPTTPYKKLYLASIEYV